MATYQILYWHDIPSQIRVREQGERISKPLSQRFLNAIDAAAMAAGLTGSDEYAVGFHWGDAVAVDYEGELDEIAEAVLAEVEAQFADIDWEKTVEKLKALYPPEEEPLEEEAAPAEEETAEEEVPAEEETDEEEE